MQRGPEVCSLVPTMGTGVLWAVDAYGCDPDALRSADRVGAVLDAVVRDAGLKPLGAARWHTFPGPGGVTGFVLLTESHLACHTYPEHRFATFDLHCCRPGAAWDWERGLRAALAAERVVVRRIERGGDVAG